VTRSVAAIQSFPKASRIAWEERTRRYPIPSCEGGGDGLKPDKTAVVRIGDSEDYMNARIGYTFDFI
jgi:hypothetical protein